MDDVAVSRQSHKKGNKENARPANGYKSFIKSDKTSAAPFQLKSIKKEETMVRNVPPKAKAERADTRSDTEQRDGNVAAAAAATVAQVPKPAAPVTSSRSAPGMYKGKIIQSKIGSIWKSSATVSGADVKPESQRVGCVTKMSSVQLPGHGTQKRAQTNPKSLLDGSAQVSKPAVTSRPRGGSCSTRPPARTVPATQTTTSSRTTKMAPNKRNGAQSPKPKIPETGRQVNKPRVSSTLSQYRLRMETEEGKRAKLAEWLASKGKTLKRPAMTAAAPVKTTTSAKPEADLQPQPQLAAQRNPDTEAQLEAPEPGSAAAAAAAAHCADTQRAQLPTRSQTPGILNTSLDLLENSDADLPVDPQDCVDDVVVNLCDALEALATPSQSNDEPSQATGACSEVEVEESRPKEDELNNGMPEGVGEQLQVEQVMAEVEEEADEEESDDCVVVTTPQMEGASVVKYNVKTTPYLQSVKKTITDDAGASASRRRSNIRDLKYLTPVRRSCRIQRNSSQLPTMLLDHDPCVSSLAELVKLDHSNAYIYRKNPTLLEDLPDQNGE